VEEVPLPTTATSAEEEEAEETVEEVMEEEEEDGDEDTDDEHEEEEMSADDEESPPTYGEDDGDEQDGAAAEQLEELEELRRKFAESFGRAPGGAMANSAGWLRHKVRLRGCKAPLGPWRVHLIAHLIASTRTARAASGDPRAEGWAVEQVLTCDSGAGRTVEQVLTCENGAGEHEFGRGGCGAAVWPPHPHTGAGTGGGVTVSPGGGREGCCSG
jgi:hypothetical protein